MTARLPPNRKSAMAEDRFFYTATMARIHAQQGDLAKAAEIYRHLLRRDPGRQDLAEELAKIEARMQRKSANDLVPLFEQWAALNLKYRRLARLETIRRRLTGTGEDPRVAETREPQGTERSGRRALSKRPL